MTLIKTSFNAATSAEEVIDGVDLTGKRMIVTGGASGIGIETARALAGRGAEVTLAVRNPESGRQAAADITASTGNSNIHVAHLDLLDKLSIVSFVTNWSGSLDVLINNAGVMGIPELQKTSEGYEKHFAANYLGHFALAVGFHHALAQTPSARIVSVSSADFSGRLGDPIQFEDIHFSHRPYDPFAAYIQSKAANVLFAVGVNKHWAKEGITANALMPGAIATNLQRYIDIDTLKSWGAADASGNRMSQPEGWKTPEQGAATSVLLAASPLLEGIGGRYFVDCNESDVINNENNDIALNPHNADRLWDMYYPTVSNWFK